MSPRLLQGPWDFTESLRPDTGRCPALLAVPGECRAGQVSAQGWVASWAQAVRFRDPLRGKSTSVPLAGPFIFTYNRGHGECKSPVSNIESCTEESRLLLSFQACPDVQGTESTGKSRHSSPVTMTHHLALPIRSSRRTSFLPSLPFFSVALLLLLVFPLQSRSWLAWQPGRTATHATWSASSRTTMPFRTRSAIAALSTRKSPRWWVSIPPKGKQDELLFGP